LRRLFGDQSIAIVVAVEGYSARVGHRLWPASQSVGEADRLSVEARIA
jgi:hypothetical protein